MVTLKHVDGEGHTIYVSLTEAPLRDIIVTVVSTGHSSTFRISTDVARNLAASLVVAADAMDSSD